MVKKQTQYSFPRAGLTETCGAATLGFPDEMCMLGTAGAVGVYNELRLEEVPEMGYNPLGNPSTGEICLRGKSVFAGYYKNTQLTNEAIKDGWFHTGTLIRRQIPTTNNHMQIKEAHRITKDKMSYFYNLNLFFMYIIYTLKIMA